MSDFILENTISLLSDNEFRNAMGVDRWNEINTKLLEEHKYTCQGCEFPKADKNWLNLHIISGDILNPENSVFTILCLACHTIQHLDKATEKGLIKLVNSSFSQAELIRRCRGGNRIIKEDINNGNIILLGIEPIVYVNKLKESIINKIKTIKVIFGKNFDWSTCR